VSLGAAFVRVSTGSQNETSQVKAIEQYARDNGVTLVPHKFILHGYSASKGEQEPALREAIADMERGYYSLLIVTESRSLDRREDLDVQAEILLDIRRAGGDVISISEPQFGKTDFAGRIVTLVAQQKNLEKSKEVKKTTYRGISMVRDNKAHHGALPAFWQTKGQRYAKQAYCANPAAVADIYERVANGESLPSIGRRHVGRNGKTLYPQSIKNLVRFAANHTGVIECSYTHEGQTETWAHEVEPVIDSPVWWRANKVLAVNMTDDRGNKGGRPVAWPSNWISGVLDCPECGEKIFLNAGKSPQGNPRTPKLRCGGNARERLACGRFKGTDAQPVIDLITDMFANDPTEILAFQRVAGNAHELDALKASLPRLQAQLSVITDRATRRGTLAQIEALEDRIDSFEVIADDFDYAPTGQTVAQMWNDGDDIVKRGMVRAVKASWGMILAHHEGQWRITVETEDSKDLGSTNGIVDLGNGLCFRR
jgi:DNA invertase Pin-like site-specific DNA recombinase